MTGQFEDEPAARYVGVGIETYKEKAYPPLPGAPAEVRKIAQLLSARGVRTTVAAATTEIGLIAELARVLPPQPVGGEGQLVVLWAGHGDRLPDASLRLVAEDTAKRGAALLTAEYVASVAVRSGATQVLLIFDTCFSGGGALPVLAGADRWFSEQEGPPGKVWLGVLASAMDWQKARDDLFGDRLARLLRDGPSQEELRLRWSAHNAGIRGDDLIDALQKEWPDSSPHRPKTAQFGNSWALLPNPQHDPAAPPRVVEHLLLAARGGEPEDEAWYFTGRRVVIDRLVSWMGSGRPGLHVVTGPAGCGKSAVLGLVVCLSHPEQRAALLARGPLGYPDPGVGSVHAHVYARGLARGQLVREIDVQLSDAGVLPGDRRGARGAGELADAAAASATRPVVVVVDGLDEAGVEAWPVAEEVLRPLARHALVLVGTRELAAPEGEDSPVTRLQPDNTRVVHLLEEASVKAWPVAEEVLRPLARHALVLTGIRELAGPEGGDSLVTRLQPDSTQVVHLLEEVDDPADVHDYVARLSDVPALAMDTGQVADAVLALPGGREEGRFLLARIITAQLRAHPVDTSLPGWQQQLSTSVEMAFDRDLYALPTRVRGEDRLPAAGFDLLAALSWAQGGGLPDDIWPLIATAVSAGGTGYGRDDAFWALTKAGRYIVEAGEAGHAVYRLSHQRLGQHLRSRTRDNGVQDAELRIATALVNAYQEMLAAGVSPAGHAYLWRYTWRHCADAGTAGIAALRRLVRINRAAFLPDLAIASRYLASRQLEAGKPFDAVGPAEDTVAVYRELAVANPAYLPDLAGALDDLGTYYSGVGRRADAVPPAEEAVTIYRDQAAAHPAYLPDLAAALGNLGGRYREVGRHADAVPPAEEAVTLYREPAAANPAYRPDLAGALDNLGIHYSGVGRRADAVSPAEEAVTIYRELAAAMPDRYRPDLARSLDNLGIRFSELGRPAKALPVTQEAVTIYHELAAAMPDRYRPDLADSLSNLGVRSSALGRPAEALPVTQEAVTIYRELAADMPDRYRPHLAASLSNLGVWFSELGRPAEALPVTQEAVAIRRELAAAMPGRYRPDLARSLDNLGVWSSALGRPAEALPVTQEAVTIRRELAAAMPDRYRPHLAASLFNLGVRFSELGRRAEALPVTQEAVTIYRELAADMPDRYRPDLARSLDNLGNRYSEVGRRADAVAPAEEAVTIYRELAADMPDRYRPHLARSLDNLGGRLSELGRPAEALPVTQEAVTIHRELAAAIPDRYRPDLARSLSNLGVRLSELGRPAEALPVTQEAVAIRRELAADMPDRYRPDLARSLDNLGGRLSELGRPAEALPVTQEAVTIYRELAADMPDRYRPDLARSLDSLGVRFSELGRPAKALPVTQEAVTIRRELADDMPDRYRPALAASLSKLAIWFSALGRNSEASAAREEALAIRSSPSQ